MDFKNPTNPNWFYLVQFSRTTEKNIYTIAPFTQFDAVEMSLVLTFLTIFLVYFGPLYKDF